MNEIEYLTGLAVTFTLAIAVVGFLWRPLSRILLDLCGTTDRARFWTTFSALILVLGPLVPALHLSSPAEGRVFEMGWLLERGILGLVLSLLVIGMTLGHFIDRAARKP